MNPKVIQILEKKFGVVKKSSGDWVRIACPTCDKHHSKKFKRYINTETLGTKCWICDVKLSFKKLTGVHVAPNVHVSHEQKPKEVDPRARVLPCTKSVPINELSSDHPAIKFLAKDYLFELNRYYDENKIVYCPYGYGEKFGTDPFITASERLIFPVHFNGKLVGWQMRSIPGTFYGDREGGVRYYHLFDKGNYLYNYDNAKKFDKVILVEGVKKALKFPNAVASLGKNISTAQIQLLYNWKDVTIMLDDDKEAQPIAQNLTRELTANGLSVRNIALSKYGFKSPDEARVEELQQILNYELGKR